MGGVAIGYRSAGAQRIHYGLMCYVRDSDATSVNNFKEALFAATDAEVTELSINQDSVLQDILHLPAAIISEQDLANKEEIIESKTSSLLGCLWNRIKDNNQLIECLCTSKNSAGFTPLHDALTGNSANLSLYLDLLKECDSELQTQVLTSANKTGFTPLHQALKEGNPDNVSLYLEHLTSCDSELQTKVLTSANAAGFTPLHQALKEGNPENISLYIGLLTSCDPELQTKVLTTSNNAGFTPLHQALKEGDPGSLSLYLNLLTKCDKPLQAQVLTCANSAGFTPLHSALEGGNPGNVSLYVDLLKESDKSLQTQVLTSANKAGFTPLHQALKEGDPGNLILYLNLLKECDSELQTQVLTSATKDGFTPLHEALKEGNPYNVRLYLDLLTSCDPELQAQVLTSANAAGFTPLHEALTGNSANLSLYLGLLRSCNPELQTQVLTSANAAGFTPLHQALKEGSKDNARLYLNRIQDLLDKNTLRRLLYAKNRSGYTSMHQALGSKNAVAISEILIGFVKRNFYEDDANEIIQYLLYTRIKNYLPSANKKTHGNKLANEIDTCLRDLRRQYPERDGYTDTNRSQPSNGGGNSHRYDNYRRLSSHSAYASGPHQARSGEYSYNNHGNRSSFFRSTPQVGLGSGHAPRSQNYDDGKRSRDDYNRYTHDDRRNKPYRR